MTVSDCQILSETTVSHEHGRRSVSRLCSCGTAFKTESGDWAWVSERMRVMVYEHINGALPRDVKHILPAMVGRSDRGAICGFVFQTQCSCGDEFKSPRWAVNQHEATKMVTAWKNNHRIEVREIKKMSKIDSLLARKALLDAEILRLEALPTEPTTEDPEGALVIWFTKTFGQGQAFTYAAVKAGDGLWYTTGPRTPKGFAWENLVEWMYEGDPNVQIWKASEFIPV